ncbi:MAG TPA: hypothetical protein VH186_00285 [Chloroflexia bacterium]|nr:hypothetical protein [Chloroflexia bacterium]
MRRLVTRFSLLAVALFMATLCFTVATPTVAEAATDAAFIRGTVTQPRPQVGQQTQIVFEFGNRSQHTLQLSAGCSVSSSVSLDKYPLSPDFFTVGNQFFNGTGCFSQRTFIPGQNYNFQLNLTAVKTGTVTMNFGLNFKDTVTNQIYQVTTGPLTITVVPRQ